MRPLTLTLVCALALVVPAQAQDPQVDPGSPAGTEYQLPLDRARDEAGGGPGSQGDTTAGEAPLFGAGVEQEKTKSRSESKKSGTDSDPATTAEVERDLGTSTPETVRAQAPTPDSGGSGIATIGGGAAAVLLVGGLTGLAWRRRATQR